MPKRGGLWHKAVGAIVFLQKTYTLEQILFSG